MTDLGDRHSSNVGGRLAAEPRSVHVGVIVEPAASDEAATQHVAWMLINLLARLKGTVRCVSLECPETLLAPRVSPLSPLDGTLGKTLLDGASQIGGVPVEFAEAGKAEVLLTVGPGGLPSSGWRVFGEGFAGAISQRGVASRGADSLPFGPYVAACLAAAEVFRFTRLPEAKYEPTDSVSFSLLDYGLGGGDLDGRKVLPDELMLDFGLAGVGAVGCAVLQALWACPGLAGRAVIADGDSEGVNITNLNRCAIFAHRHIGLPKASTAAALLEDCGITWAPVDGLYAQGQLPWVPPTLLSAVDTNRSRISLQEGFWPGRLLGASTLDLRAEVCRFGPAGIGPCLCCFNPPELAMPDDLRRDRLREEGDEAMATLAEKVGCSLEDVRAWVEKGECGEVEAAVLSELRATDEQDRSFSVGFVSVFAGVALAAELVKETAGWQTPLNDEFGEANFQFLRPTAEENGNPRQVQRDPACRHCESGSAALDVWRRRETRWTPPSREQVV